MSLKFEHTSSQSLHKTIIRQKLEARGVGAPLKQKKINVANEVDLTVENVESLESDELKLLSARTRERLINQYLFQQQYNINKLKPDFIKNLKSMPTTLNKVDALRHKTQAEKNIKIVQEKIVVLREDYDALQKILESKIPTTADKERLERLAKWICEAYVALWGEEKVATTMQERIEDFNVLNKK